MKAFFEKHHIHYAWVIMAACFFLYGSAMGAVQNCQGVFYEGVSAAMGWKISSFSSYYIWQGITGTIMLLFVSRFFERFPLKPVLAIAASVFGLTCLAMSRLNSILQFSIVGIVQGAAGSFLLYVPVPMLINSWFQEKKGTALSVSQISSGIFAGLLSPVYSKIIHSIGWRQAYVWQGIIMLALSLPVILFVIVKEPADIGLLPYGAERAGKEHAETAVPAYDPTASLTKRQKTLRLVLTMFSTAVFIIASAVAHQAPKYAVSLGLSASLGATMVSLSSLGNIIAKLVGGTLADRLGNRTSAALLIGITTAGILILSFPFSIPTGLYVGALMQGTASALTAVVMPLACTSFASGRDYTRAISMASMVNTLLCSFASTLFGLSYDGLGSYVYGFVICAAGLLICLFISPIIQLPKQKKTA